MQGKVSMVMPCYNKVKYIGRMFDSILAQEWDNVELILVNDGSTDGTREIIAEYEPRFAARGFETRIIDQSNKGLSGAVYTGLLLISGDYVCQVDADDELDRGYLRKMAGWLEDHSGYDWVSCDIGFVFAGGGTPKAPFRAKKEPNSWRSSSCFGNSSPPCGN